MKYRWPGLFLLLLVVLDLVFLFLYNYSAVEVNPYLLRDIYRALHIIEGHPILVGPDFTSGSYAPGPFHYLTLVPILTIFKSPFAVIVFAILTKVGAQVLFSVYFSPVMRVPSAIIYLVMSSSAFLLERFIWINNSSFIGPFLQLMAIMLLLYWQSQSRVKRVWWLIAISLFAGGCFQTHFSMIFIIPAILLIIREKGRGKSFGGPQEYILFLGLTLLTFAPFGFAYINDRYIPMFDGPVFFNSQLGIHEFTKDWWRLFARKWQVFYDLNIFNLEVLVVVTYLFSKTSWVLFKSKGNRKTVFDKILIYTGISSFIFMAWILSGSYMRYFTVFFVPTLAYMTFDFYNLLLRIFQNKKIPASILCGILMFAGRNQFHIYPKTLGLQGKCEACVFQMTRICDYFNSRRISFEQFSKATYEFFPSNSHGSLYYLRHCFEKLEGTDPLHRARYLFVDSDYLTDSNILPAMVGRLPSEIRPFYSDMSKYESEIKEPGFTLFSIEQARPPAEGTRYSNLSYSYEFDPGVGQSFAVSTLVKEGSILYKASFCESPVFCDLYVAAKIREGNLELRFGSRLFQTKTELRPLVGRATQLKIEYLCDQEVKSLEVASTLGIIQEEQQNETLFTPLELRAPANCKEWSLLAVSADLLELSSNNSGPKIFRGEKFPLHRL